MADEPATPPDPAGDATPPADPSPKDPPAPPGDDGGDDPALGPKGEKALDAWKQRAKNAEADAKRAKDLEAELETLRTAQMSEQEKAIKEARDSARTETLSEVNERLFAAEARASGSGKLSDPDLLADPVVALRLLGLSEVPVTDTGDIDTEAISEAIDSLIESKPYLAGATPPTPPLDLGQGARGAQNQVRQLTRDDLKTMTPQQIVEAKAKGQLTDVLGATT